MHAYLDNVNKVFFSLITVFKCEVESLDCNVVLPPARLRKAHRNVGHECRLDKE